MLNDKTSKAFDYVNAKIDRAIRKYHLTPEDEFDLYIALGFQMDKLATPVNLADEMDIRCTRPPKPN